MGIGYLPRNKAHAYFPTEAYGRLVFYLQNEPIANASAEFTNLIYFTMLENTTYTLVLERHIDPENTTQSEYKITLTPIKNLITGIPTDEQLDEQTQSFTGVDDNLFKNNNVNNSISVGTLNNTSSTLHNFPAIIYQYKIEDLIAPPNTPARYYNFVFNNILFKINQSNVPTNPVVLRDITLFEYIDKKVRIINLKKDININEGDININFRRNTYYNLDNIVSIDILNTSDTNNKNVFSDSLEYILFRNTDDDTELHIPAKLYNLSKTVSRYILYNPTYTTQDYINKLNNDNTIDAEEIKINTGFYGHIIDILDDTNTNNIIKYVDNKNKLIIDYSDKFYKSINITAANESKFKDFEFIINFHTNTDFNTMSRIIGHLFDYGIFSRNKSIMGIAYNKEHSAFPENTKNKLVFYIQNNSRVAGTKIDNIKTFDILPNSTYTLKLTRRSNPYDSSKSIYTIDLILYSNNNRIINNTQTETIETTDSNLFKKDNTISIGCTHSNLTTNIRKFPGLIYEYYIKELPPTPTTTTTTTTTTTQPTTTQPTTTTTTQEEPTTTQEEPTTTQEEPSTIQEFPTTTTLPPTSTQVAQSTIQEPTITTTLPPTSNHVVQSTIQEPTITEPNNFQGSIKGTYESFTTQANNHGLLDFIYNY